MSRSGAVTVFCPANTWTQVEWYVGTILLTKRYDAGAGVFVRWRWFSAGAPRTGKAVSPETRGLRSFPAST